MFNRTRKKIISLILASVSVFCFAMPAGFAEGEAERISASDVRADGSIKISGEVPEYKYTYLGVVILNSENVTLTDVYAGNADAVAAVVHIGQTVTDKNGKYEFIYNPQDKTAKQVVYVGMGETFEKLVFSTVFVPTASSIEITGDTTALIPAEGTKKIAFSAIVKDQRGNEINDALVEWTVDEAEGVEIDKAGTVTIASGVNKKQITVTAKSGNASKSVTISLYPELSSLKLKKTDIDNRMILSGRISSGDSQKITVVVVPHTIEENSQKKVYDFDTMNKAISLMGTDKFYANVHHIYQTESTADGVFELPIVIDETRCTTTEFTAFVAGTDIYEAMAVNFAYAKQKDAGDFVLYVNQAATKSDMYGVISAVQNAVTMNALGVGMEAFNALSPTQQEDAAELLLKNRPSAGYTTANVGQALNEAVAVTFVNNATADTMATVVQNHFDTMGIDTGDDSYYKQLLTADYSAMLSAILAGTPYTSAKAVKSVYDNAIVLPIINAAMWQNMEKALEYFADTLGIDMSTQGAYKNKLSYENQVAVLKALVPTVFSTKEQIAEQFNREVSNRIVVGGNNNYTPSTSTGGGGGGNVMPVVPVQGEEPANDGFNDVPSGHWAADSIKALSEKNIIAGYENNDFRPDNSITRAEFIKIVICAFNKLNDNAVCGFDDVSSDAWYYKYVASAVEAGYVNGISEALFGSDDCITRQDMAVILDRVAKELGITAESVSELTFEDADLISDYALESVENMCALGIISGIDGKFEPMQEATRAQVARMVYLLMQMAEKQNAGGNE